MDSHFYQDSLEYMEQYVT